MNKKDKWPMTSLKLNAQIFLPEMETGRGVIQKGDKCSGGRIPPAATSVDASASFAPLDAAFPVFVLVECLGGVEWVGDKESRCVAG